MRLHKDPHRWLKLSHRQLEHILKVHIQPAKRTNKTKRKKTQTFMYIMYNRTRNGSVHEDAN